ncbi:MAG: hypothetical protein LBC59_02250 [Chitinispirillales bacterium]|jgi:hypothetical protein|nr:hypothetical protein [Chitinispirillales bacterium]
MLKIKLILIALLTFSCGGERQQQQLQQQHQQPRQDFFEVKVGGDDSLRITLDRVSDTLNIIRVKTLKDGKITRAASYPLPYPVYRFDVGDLTGDGVPDIAVGVIKTTPYDPKLAKRPFLFKINDEGEVRKLWMGSRVSQPLEDFVLSKGAAPVKVLTIERELSGKFLVAVYRYQGFGLAHNGYVKREISLEEAYKLLHIQRSML